MIDEPKIWMKKNFEALIEEKEKIVSDLKPIRESAKRAGNQYGVDGWTIIIDLYERQIAELRNVLAQNED